MPRKGKAQAFSFENSRPVPH